MRGVRTLLVVALLAIAAMWIYVLFVADPGPHPDRLEDRAFPPGAEEVCAATRSEIDALPAADETPDAQDRADVVDEADAMLRAMVAELRDRAPTAGEDGRVIQEWLGDWDTYITDRDDWSAQIRAGENVRFFETEKGGGPISELIDTFADVNDMPSCGTPDDV